MKNRGVDSAAYRLTSQVDYTKCDASIAQKIMIAPVCHGFFIQAGLHPIREAPIIIVTISKQNNILPLL